MIAREIKQKATDSYFAGTPPLALVRYVISRTATRTKTGKRRQLMVLNAKGAYLRADALTETYVKPPHLRDTERCLLLKKTVCTARFVQQQDGNTLFRKSVQTLACPAQAIVHVRLDTHHEIWTGSCMVTISSSLDVVTTSIVCHKH